MEPGTVGPVSVATSSVSPSDIVRPAASNAVTATGHHFSMPLCGPRNNSGVIVVYHAPHRRRKQAIGASFVDIYTLLEVDKIPHDLRVLTEAH